MIKHYDLFAGIGGFSLALEEVFYDEEIKHIFCEWEQFPTAVLKKHWPESEYWGDIAELVAHTTSERLEGGARTKLQRRDTRSTRYGDELTIVTGGFPCQPFSAAGRRRGTSDDRYKWPEMFAVIQNVKPDWVIAENVRGLTNWNEGMVLEQVCTDLESEGYEVQPFIIPAVAVNAPHRRDRVWIIGYAKHDGFNEPQDRQSNLSRNDSDPTGKNQIEQSAGPDIQGHNDADSRVEEPRRLSQQSREKDTEGREVSYPDWERNWQEVAFATCADTVDDGLPRKLDGATERGKRTDQISAAKWRKESLKAYGNAIVPQVAMEIFKAIKTTNENKKENKTDAGQAEAT